MPPTGGAAGEASVAPILTHPSTAIHSSSARRRRTRSAGIMESLDMRPAVRGHPDELVVAARAVPANLASQTLAAALEEPNHRRGVSARPELGISSRGALPHTPGHRLAVGPPPTRRLARGAPTAPRRVPQLPQHPTPLVRGRAVRAGRGFRPDAGMPWARRQPRGSRSTRAGRGDTVPTVAWAGPARPTGCAGSRAATRPATRPVRPAPRLPRTPPPSRAPPAPTPHPAAGLK